LSKHCSLGLDVGSVSTKLVLLDEEDNVIEKIYLRTSGRPIGAVLKGLSALAAACKDVVITSVGATGSGRQLASAIVGADIIKNEITTHAAAACRMVPEVRTIIEIGGQDSKIIFLNDGIVTDFAMNTVCAAGTGSFLDRQAARLEIPIEEFGRYAVRSECPVRIAGRCAVFAESDMISKQQAGHSNEDIIAGLCEALVRNFLNNLAKNKDIPEPVMFQGGVAANIGMSAAFERALGKSVIIPKFYDVMGAIGAALLAREEITLSGRKTNFYGFGCVNNDYTASNFECKGCTNLCEVVQIRLNGLPVANWGDRCGKWSNAGYKVI
jgi:predicted CoA-substrate-specific enzyme activase